MTIDLSADVTFAARLLLAAILGAVIGLEREIHDHPAGMRTHLLVSLGAAAFTVLSVAAFPAPGADPARLAAQVVSGIGFLGAGAILKEGATVRGLTTAASLWAVAAVGMAAGIGAWAIALTVTIIVILSLWPLRVVAERFVRRDSHRVKLRLATDDSHDLAEVVTAVTAHGGSIVHLGTERGPGASLVIDLEIRLRDAAAGVRLTTALADVDGLELLGSTAVGD